MFVQSFCNRLKKLSHRNDKLCRIKTHGVAGGTWQWGEVGNVGNGQEAPEGVKAAQPFPRAQGLERSTQIQGNCCPSSAHSLRLLT